MASIDDESGSSSKKTVGKHGVTRLQKIHKAKSNGKRIEVQWNSRGQPIKHNSKTFASFIGVTVRRLVPISLDNWSAKKNKEAMSSTLLDHEGLEEGLEEEKGLDEGTKWEMKESRILQRVDIKEIEEDVCNENFNENYKGNWPSIKKTRPS
ncbi:unnamed protein product [Vicia faba]|uniref:Uncharacterized protein n=1 Tax=Vicia faba TaxID=3906 RepID=A0AAV0ZR57_VICFA|nr:unnamed protein product [Vicia faba]